jgi:hypothetical protein
MRSWDILDGELVELHSVFARDVFGVLFECEMLAVFKQHIHDVEWLDRVSRVSRWWGLFGWSDAGSASRILGELQCDAASVQALFSSRSVQGRQGSGVMLECELVVSVQ